MNSTIVESEKCCKYFNPLADKNSDSLVKTLTPDNDMKTMKEMVGNTVEVSYNFCLVSCSIVSCSINFAFLLVVYLVTILSFLLLSVLFTGPSLWNLSQGLRQLMCS